jgi:hypothetical protein
MRVAVLSIIVLAGCRIYLDPPDAGPDAPGPTPCDEAADHSDLAWIQDKVFSASCAFGGCHLGSNPGGHLNLDVDQSRTNLVGVAATTVDGMSRVVAGDPKNSYLVVSLHDADAPGTEPAGGWMPLTNPELCQSKKDAIWRWIENGAPP